MSVILKNISNEVQTVGIEWGKIVKHGVGELVEYSDLQKSLPIVYPNLFKDVTYGDKVANKIANDLINFSVETPVATVEECAEAPHGDGIHGISLQEQYYPNAKEDTVTPLEDTAATTGSTKIENSDVLSPDWSEGTKIGEESDKKAPTDDVATTTTTTTQENINTTTAPVLNQEAVGEVKKVLDPEAPLTPEEKQLADQIAKNTTK